MAFASDDAETVHQMDFPRLFTLRLGFFANGMREPDASGHEADTRANMRMVGRESGCLF